MTLNELPTLKNLEKPGQMLIIFDDFMTDSQTKLKDYIMYARKYNIMCCFLAQSYFATDKFIRQNISYLVLLSMTDARNTNLIAHTLGLTIEKSVVKNIIKNATKFKMNVCIIDISNGDINKKFRRNFKDYYLIEDDDGELVTDIQLFSGSGLLN
jgi:tRNA pseudouridine-54 N-methylase